MIAGYLAGFDFDLPLVDAVNDPDLADARSVLAARALGEGLDAEYYEARELTEIFLDAAREANSGNIDPDSPARVRFRTCWTAIFPISARCSMWWRRCHWRGGLASVLAGRADEEPRRHGASGGGGARGCAGRLVRGQAMSRRLFARHEGRADR